MQSLRLEEHEDPNHPIVALASERIVELTVRKAAVTGALAALKTKRPAGHDPDEVLAMLDAIPDLRPALATATEGEARRDLPSLRRRDHLRPRPANPQAPPRSRPS
jgi:hypothetical protein